MHRSHVPCCMLCQMVMLGVMLLCHALTMRCSNMSNTSKGNLCDQPMLNHFFRLSHASLHALGDLTLPLL